MFLVCPLQVAAAREPGHELRQHAVAGTRPLLSRFFSRPCISNTLPLASCIQVIIPLFRDLPARFYPLAVTPALVAVGPDISQFRRVLGRILQPFR
jgi:hypothetical protein